MLRLLYVSQITGGVAEDQIRDILESSRRNNPAQGITGVLVHGGGLFMQVLEGPEENVLRMYVRIIDDKRNGNCQIIHISPADERMFQNWSMGVIRCDPLEFQHINELRTRRLEAVHANTFRLVLKEFVARLNAGRQSPTEA